MKIERSLNTSMLSNADVRNLALQRTGSLKGITVFGKRFSPSYYLWSKFGSNILLDVEVSFRRGKITRIALDEIECEFQQIWEKISDTNVSAIMDIGCGLGMIDVMFGLTGKVSKIALVDIETSDRKHHGFEDEGAGYNSLDTTSKFVLANIAKNIEIISINPQCNPMNPAEMGYYDLIMSLISCGFHYPATTYLATIKSLLKEGGLVLLDLRHGVDHSDFLREFEIVIEIRNSETHRRVLLRRTIS